MESPNCQQKSKGKSQAYFSEADPNTVAVILRAGDKAYSSGEIRSLLRCSGTTPIRASE